MKIPQRLDRLRHALKGSLPGHSALKELSGYLRPSVEKALALDPRPRESAVLALIYPRKGELHTLLMLRPIYEGVHSGQISFPGGKREEGDTSLEYTALREFTEETGSTAAEISILGSLSQIYIPPSRVIVTPFVAYTPDIGTCDPDPNEVAALIEAPLDMLLRGDILKRRQQYIELMGGEVEIPYYDVQGHVVWGATAMMIAELRELFLWLGDADDL
ncbi:MAG: CoA pyrophosphatase [Bacteroidota bacterium]|nr:CoA pyrophosphatase [Bacteroidota bacterium]